MLKYLLIDTHRAGIGDLICLSSSLAVLSEQWEITVIGKEKNIKILDLFKGVRSFMVKGEYDKRVRIILPDGANGLNRQKHLIDAFAVQFGLHERVELPKVIYPIAKKEIPDVRRVITIAVDAGRPNKTWPFNLFEQLVIELAMSSYIVQVGGGARLPRVHFDARGYLEYRDLAEWLYTSNLYIGCDSGLAHLAAAIGVPSVIIYGATDPAFYTYGIQRAVYNKTGCYGCFNKVNYCSKEVIRGCPFQRDMECLNNINVGEVLSAIEEVLKK